jgi:DNA mismatch repair protein MutL
MSIRLLSSEVIDQIAAGEVVERPSHMVKELVENSLDAGSTEVEIEFDQGGRRVRVTDNGKGIATEQLALALARHATSKISKADDLWKLGTYGFRGEALATVAAVSKLMLTSRTFDADTASQITNEFGINSKPETVGANPGTTVLVEELFSNVPARLKFLKSESAESSQIKNTLKALALARPDVEFRIRSAGKLLHVWPRAGSHLERAEQILETKLFSASYSFNGFEVQASFASPHNVSGQARQIWIFVQGRWVQDRGLQAALIDAYRGLLMHGEYPIASIQVKCPPEEVDVNIHPAKSAVRFRDNQSAFRAVHRCLREGLEKAPWIENQTGVRAPTNSYESALELTPSEPQALSFESPELNRTQYQKRELSAAHYDAVKTAAKAAPTYLDSNGEADSFVRNIEKQEVRATSFWSQLQVLGQAHLTYILAENNSTLYLVDQHAAHERIAYERLMSAWKNGQIERQDLLLPLTVTLEPEAVEAIAAQSSALAKIGIELEPIGHEAIAIRSMPVGIAEKAVVSSLKELAREILEKGGGFALERKISDLCATMACHSVVRAGQALSVEQMQTLLEQMDEFPLSSFCPHGRPVSVEYPYQKLERDFGRIV